MASRKGGKSEKSLKDITFERPHFDISVETKQSIAAVGLLLLGIICFLSLFDLAGLVGGYVNRSLTMVFGVLRFLAPVLILILGYFLLRPNSYRLRFSNYIGAIVLAASFSGFVHLILHSSELLFAAERGDGGGWFGFLLSSTFHTLFGFWAGLLLLLSLTVIGLFLLFNTSFVALTEQGVKMKSRWQQFHEYLLERRIKRLQEERESQYQQSGGQAPSDAQFEVKEVKARVKTTLTEHDEESDEEEDGEDFEEDEEQESEEQTESRALTSAVTKFKQTKIDVPLDLLTGKTTAPKGGDLEANKLIIQRTLDNFGIPCEMHEAQVGPTVTQYTLKPAEGVKLSRITTLNDNLSLALAAHPIRIEAPIPGRSLVGIEVPNATKASVPLRDMILSDQFKQRSSNLMLSLGKDVMGVPWFTDLKKLPHLLIAGSTGSGKSVCINTLILSLLYQNGPGDLKFIMVDPKRVELPIYNNIPHLLTPVITDTKKTINALRWAIGEMERRFEVLSKVHKRNIESYNEIAEEKMPYIVFIIDELADLMVSAAAEVETAIIRLAQMARAVGIHLVLATQRPSVDVITGLIKANVTARVAFSVASLVDSRTILDTAGAEKLLGRGDMLFVSSELGKPKRLQGAWASDEEIKRVTDYIKDQAEPEYIQAVVEKDETSASGLMGGDSSNDGDPLLQQAKEVIIQAKKASASLLQRRLSVGYARAARILDLLEEQGFIGPADGAKPRELLASNAGTPKMPVSGVPLHTTGEIPLPTDGAESDDEDVEEDAEDGDELLEDDYDSEVEEGEDDDDNRK